MPDAKPVVSSQAAVASLEKKDVNAAQGPVVPPAPEKKAETPPAPPKKKWKFVKVKAVAQVLRFKDGSEFKFPLTILNSTKGYANRSTVVTEDEKLAKNLRSLSPDFGVVEEKC